MTPLAARWSRKCSDSAPPDGRTSRTHLSRFFRPTANLGSSRRTARNGLRDASVHDVGVAGLHRLVSPLRNMIAFDPDALIVAAGMDGVLPGVISGLVPIPIVALPTSTGYGFGGEGLGAMTTMLQACAPGIAVVNIDNGVGAGVMAGLIANRAASQRSCSFWKWRGSAVELLHLVSSSGLRPRRQGSRPGHRASSAGHVCQRHASILILQFVRALPTRDRVLPDSSSGGRRRAEAYRSLSALGPRLDNWESNWNHCAAPVRE